MAWNHSESGAAKVPRKTGGRKSPSVLRGVFAALIVVVLGVVVLYLVTSGNDEKVVEAAPTKPSSIMEATPELDTKPRKTPEQIAAEEYANDKTSMPTRVGELRNGYRLLPSGRMHRVYGTITNTVQRTSVVEKTFKHDADIELGNLLMVEPGESFIGESSDYYDNFEAVFKAAIKEEIEFDKDDTELQRELKQAVIDMRKELKESMDRGEDIVKIMRDTREQLREIGLYREELEAQVIKITKEGQDLTQQDYDDLVSAANKMLEDRGSKPMELPSSLKHMMHLNQLRD